MSKYLFASLRGDDFTAEGNTPQEAYLNLCNTEKDHGSLWKTLDPYRNRAAVEKQGFTLFDEADPSKGAFKLIQ